MDNQAVKQKLSFKLRAQGRRIDQCLEGDIGDSTMASDGVGAIYVVATPGHWIRGNKKAAPERSGFEQSVISFDYGAYVIVRAPATPVIEIVMPCV